MARKTINIFPGTDFEIVHDIDEKPNQIDFKLHNHDDIYEIVLLLSGDCEFYVEGNTYAMKPHDIIITRPFELHHITCLTEKPYERILLFIKTDYFEKYSCQNYLEVFRNRPLGIGNLIAAEVAGTKLIPCIQRLSDYADAKEYKVAEHALFEFLYLLNRTKNEALDFYTKDERIRNVILYINEHLSEEINLDTLAAKFYTSKYHLCRVFKQSTGYTITQYANYKRIMVARELHKSGMTLLQASLEAGFNSYPHFYRTYLRFIGKAPNDEY